MQEIYLEFLDRLTAQSCLAKYEVGAVVTQTHIKSLDEMDSARCVQYSDGKEIYEILRPDAEFATAVQANMNKFYDRLRRFTNSESKSVADYMHAHGIGHIQCHQGIIRMLSYLIKRAREVKGGDQQGVVVSLTTLDRQQGMLDYHTIIRIDRGTTYQLHLRPDSLEEELAKMSICE